MNWIEVAAKARSMLPERPAYGEKQSAMADAAKRLGMTRQSLRNILAAHDFLRTIEKTDPSAFEALRDTPYSAVEIYSRWSTYDRDTALRHAVWAKQKGASVKSIIADEKAARARANTTPTASPLLRLISQNGALARLAAPGRELFSQLGLDAEGAQWTIRTPSDAFSAAMGVRTALTFLSTSDWDRAAGQEVTDSILPGIGLIELQKRTLAETYRKVSKDVLARAVAASTRYAMVMVVAPDSSALEQILPMLPRQYDRRVTNGPAPMLRAAPCIGAVAFSSWETIDADISGN